MQGKGATAAQEGNECGGIKKSETERKPPGRGNRGKTFQISLHTTNRRREILSTGDGSVAYLSPSSGGDTDFNPSACRRRPGKNSKGEAGSEEDPENARVARDVRLGSER